MVFLSKSSQSGMSLLGVLVVILLVGALFTCAYAMVPAYYDNYLIQQGLKSLADPQDSNKLRMLKKSEAKAELGKFFNLNGVREVTIDHVDVDRRKERTLVNFNYEVRKNLFANVDVVMVFKNQIDSTQPDECCQQKFEVKEKSDKK